MSAFSLRRYLPCFDIVNRFYTNIFPNAIAREKYVTTVQQMAPQKPYQRFYQPEPSIQLPGQYRNLLPDEYCGKKCNYVRANVTKRRGKTGKSSDSLVVRRCRRSRTVFTNEQITKLEYYFMQCTYVNSERAEELAAKLCLDAAPIKCWFKNQRRRIKIKENARQKECSKNVETEHIPLRTPPPTTDSYQFNPSYCNQMINSTTVVTSQEQPHQQNHHQHQALNFNRITYFNRMSSPMSTEDANSMTTISTNSDTSDYFSQMSPDSEICDPLTPSRVLGEANSVFNDILDSLNTPKIQPTIEHIYDKLTSGPEPIFNSAFDTMLQPYESERNSTNTAQQLTYCLELI